MVSYFVQGAPNHLGGFCSVEIRQTYYFEPKEFKTLFSTISGGYFGRYRREMGEF